MTTRSSPHLALLRGINLAGKNKLGMADLRAVFEDLGCADVRTHIQSGNVLFRAGAPLAKRVGAAASRELAARFGLEVPVVTRSRAQMRAVRDGNPFRPGTPEKALHVVFLADRPGAARARALDPERSPGDAFQVRGAEVYLSCPRGIGRSKLTTAWFDRQLQTVSTIRNWNTVQTLCALLDEG